MRSRGSRVVRSRGSSVVRFRFGSLISSISVNNLSAHLLREGQLNSLAGGGSKAGHTLLKGLRDIFDGRDGDALLLGEVLAGDSGEDDGDVDTGLDGLGVGDIDGGLDGGDNGVVVTGLLGDLLAVVVSVSLSVSVLSRLADGDHLGLALLHKGDLDGLGGGGLSLGLVGVGADLVGNLLGGLRADSSGDGVALLNVNYVLPGKFNGLADGLEGGGADLSSLYNIEDGAVVLGGLV